MLAHPGLVVERKHLGAVVNGSRKGLLLALVLAVIDSELGRPFEDALGQVPKVIAFVKGSRRVVDEGHWFLRRALDARDLVTHCLELVRLANDPAQNCLVRQEGSLLEVRPSTLEERFIGRTLAVDPELRLRVRVDETLALSAEAGDGLPKPPAGLTGGGRFGDFCSRESATGIGHS